MEVGNSSGKHRPAGAAVVRQSRVREQTGHLTRNPPDDHLIGAASPLYSNFSLENYSEIVNRFTFAAHDLSRLKVHLLKMLSQPVELLAG